MGQAKRRAVVLLVDDEAELVSTLAERLAFRGIEADWVTSSDEALRRVESNAYVVAVLDVKMPGVSGVALKRELDARRPGIKYIFLTGHGSEEDFKAAMSEPGVVDYLPKPVRIDVLIEKMSGLLGTEE